jgi:transcriptional regulator with GAF, ATPase, and Fis domain
LLLDEIGDMPLAAQAKLLRVLQDGRFEPLGSDETVRVDVRVIAATHVDLEAAVRRGEFREDLFYRLSVFPVEVPALRQRHEDIVPLAESILAELAARSGRGPWSLGREARTALLAHDWPGNVRELRNTLERATILQPRGRIDPAHLGLRSEPTAAAPTSVAEDDTGFPDHTTHERQYFQAALARTGGKIYGDDGAAALVGLKPTTLQSKLRKLGLR